jgi:4-diphosphocytidyl-2-C-methyl-D-erythritol kinase
MIVVSAWVNAWAKINIDLRVLARRADNYHELRTIFQTISLADSIGIEYQPSDCIEIEIQGNVTIEDNLIARATRLVMEHIGLTGRIRFTLEKRIPMGAGLGGGSADAAAVLRTLPKVIGVAIAPARLHQMAASLGSDVPFFLYGGTAVGLGRGDEVYPLRDLASLHGLLVTPGIHISTPDAYRALSARISADSQPAKLSDFAAVVWTEDLTLARNDFEEVVFEMHPELDRIRHALENAGAVCARMTGSGSSIFGLFRERPPNLDLSHRVHPFSFVSRPEYQSYFDSSVSPTNRELD